MQRAYRSTSTAKPSWLGVTRLGSRIAGSQGVGSLSWGFLLEVGEDGTNLRLLWWSGGVRAHREDRFGCSCGADRVSRRQGARRIEHIGSAHDSTLGPTFSPPSVITNSVGDHVEVGPNQAPCHGQAVAPLQSGMVPDSSKRCDRRVTKSRWPRHIQPWRVRCERVLRGAQPTPFKPWRARS